MSKVKYKNIIILLGIMILILGVTFFAKAIKPEHLTNDLIGYNQDWYYMQDDQKMPIILPADIQLKDEDSFTVYNDHIASNYAGKYVYVTNAIYRPEISLDNALLYHYDDGGLVRNPPELSYQICKAKISESNKNGILKITFNKSNNNTISIPEVHVGSGDTIVRNLFFTNAYITVITITMITLGLLLILARVIILNQKYDDKRKLLMLGSFLFIIGVWCATDSPLLQYLLDYSNVNMNADFFVFMFLVLPFVGYVECISGMEKYKSLKWIILISLINIVIQTSLALFNVFTYIEMVPVTHILIVLAVIISILFLYREYKQNKVREVFLCLRAFMMAGIFAVISIIIYFLKPELFYQNLFQTGLLLFVLILMLNIITEFIESFQYKAEVKVYKQLAEVDKLTNLANRRRFDEKILKIEQNADKYENILLVFIDVNGLKWINDSYGHAKGDEIIITAGKCVKRAYKDSNSCYRIGGDEFCVIIENPTFDQQEAIDLIENEVESYNCATTNDFHFTVAIGCSFLKEDGIAKNIAKWKEEADYKMYEDKKKKKFYNRN